MIELIEANWLLFVAALAIGILAAWWIFVASRRTRVEFGKDAEGPGRAAKRNQALIDAPPVSAEGASSLSRADADPESASAAADPPAPVTTARAPAATGDDLTRIKGVGPRLAEQLRVLEVTGFSQIAAWDDTEIDRIDALLGRFQGRIRRDDWPAQARLLAAGDLAEYESRFGKL